MSFVLVFLWRKSSRAVCEYAACVWLYGVCNSSTHQENMNDAVQSSVMSVCSDRSWPTEGAVHAQSLHLFNRLRYKFILKNLPA